MANKRKIAVVDYGTGNIASLIAALRIVGANPFLARSPQDISRSDALVMPGVGHFSTAVESLHKYGLFNCIVDSINKGLPTLGICLGFQLLTLESEEAPGIKGLGCLPLFTIRMNPINKLKHKVPHIGWNNMNSEQGESKLLKMISFQEQLFYYSNAYAIKSPSELNFPHALYNHDSNWLGLIEKENIFGVQFHPEKSRKQGRILLNNFLKLIS